MSDVIYRTTLEEKDEQVITVPSDAEFLHAAVHNNSACLWYRCSIINKTHRPDAQRTIVMFGTSDPVVPSREMGRYIGTVHLRGGNLAKHIFWVLAK